MKTEKELDALDKKLKELNEEELNQVTGGDCGLIKASSKKLDYI